jgi:hypothetical protein
MSQLAAQRQRTFGVAEMSVTQKRRLCEASLCILLEMFAQ